MSAPGWSPTLSSGASRGGLVLNFLDLPLPAVLDQFAAMLGGAALPTALFALGANLSRFHLDPYAAGIAGY